MHIRHCWRKHVAVPAGRYLRLEVEPGTRAHEVCAKAPVTQGMLVTFGGALVVDTDGPFLEIHPDETFEVGWVGTSSSSA